MSKNYTKCLPLPITKMCQWFRIRKGSVAVTDLLSLANQCPRQTIRPNTDQSGAERIDSIYRSRTFSSSPFWTSPQVREHPASSDERPLSRQLLWKIFTEDHAATSYSHKRAVPAACHTSYLLQWYTFYKLENQHSTGDTKKNLFSLWLKFTSAIRINLSL